MSDFKLTIFDCDGVLVDSEIIGIRIEVDLLQSAGYTIATETMTERFAGMSWNEILLTLERESGLALTEQLLGKTESLLDTRLPAEVQAIAGVDEVLEALTYPRCVCSNTKLPRVEAMLTKTGLKHHFGSNIFSAKDLGEGRSKPKPDIFLYGAQKMGFLPSETVVIEDSVHGVLAARAAGMSVIGFTGGSHTYPNHARNLRDAGADRTVADMRDLPSVIEDLVGTLR